MGKKQITIVKDGPCLVGGNIPLDEQIIESVGEHYEYRQGRVFETPEQYALCRCGRSAATPFCDGSHGKAGFRGYETADESTFAERKRVLSGPTLELSDDGRCAYARFCHRDDGDVWTLTEQSGDPHLRQEAIRAAGDCPAGRLVERDRLTQAEFEPALEPAISILQDPELSVSGPLFVKGGIPLVGADGRNYETRNRYALCRCGASRNKPFCDAAHVNTGYQDGLGEDD